MATAIKTPLKYRIAFKIARFFGYNLQISNHPPDYEGKIYRYYTFRKDIK